jgi:hypothetical protein
MRRIGVSLSAVLAAATLLATLLGTTALGAQVRADPGVVIGGRVAVRVNVTLADEDTPYSPVRGLTLAFTRPASDTVLGRTDEAGVVTVLLPPGSYTISAPTSYAWKGAHYSWSVPVAVVADMPPVNLDRSNARVSGNPTRIARVDPSRQVQSSGDVNSVPAGTRSGDARTIPWLSMEVGAEGGLTRLGNGRGSDASFGGAGSFVGGLGPVALAVGYRYTRIRYGSDLDPASLDGGSAEVRYHLRPGAAAIRPYVGVVGSVGRWNESESLADERSTLRMFGGTLGAQFGLATSVRLHVSATAAGTNIRTSTQTTNTGLFTAANVGLTFDIFSPAR